MPRFIFRPLFATVCLSLATVLPAVAQTATATPSTNAPAATPPTAAIPLPDVIAQAETAMTSLQDDQTNLTSDTTAQTINTSLPALTDKIVTHLTNDALLATNATLSSLQSAQTSWQSLSDELATSEKTLSDRIKQVDKKIIELGQLQAKWQATSDSAKTASPEITQHIQAVLAAIGQTTKMAQANQNQLFSVQSSVAGLRTRIKSGMANIAKLQDTARDQLFQQDHPYLWNVDANAQVGQTIVTQEKASLTTQLGTLRTYLEAKIPELIIHLVVFALLVFGLFWIRRTIHLEAEKEAALAHAARIFDLPVATGVVLALLASNWLYPDAPALMLAGIGAVALLPAVIIIRRLIEPTLFPVLYATVIAYLADQLRYVLMPAGLLSRYLFLFELMAVSIFLLAFLRSRHLAVKPDQPSRLARLMRTSLHVVFFGLLLAGWANVLGYVHLGYLIGKGTLESSYLAVILYAAVRIIDALAIASLNIRPLSGFGMIRHHRELVYEHVSTGIRWIIFILWVISALQLFQVLDPIWHWTASTLEKEHSYGSMKDIKLGPILAFPLTIWASLYVSRFLRFALEEEVYPKLHLSKGVPYAASTTVHYLILVITFYLAARAAGVDLTQLTFLASAFAVGLGFGLQNILNNFVSGIILLFERPIKIGDIVQTDATTMGTVERIGIRASVIRLTNGSELIVPNGNLISNPVTNWTLSSNERLIEIPISVTSPADPNHVADLLTEAVKTHASVLRNPPPQTLLATFTGASLSFKVRVWVDSEEDWMKITSDLSFTIHSALAEEKVSIS